MAYDSVFKRVEKKYRTTPRQRAAVEAAARDTGAMAVDVYGRTRITSLYVDTPERAMIARSVEKALYKEKLRLRAYGEAAGTALMAAFGAGPLVRNADRRRCPMPRWRPGRPLCRAARRPMSRPATARRPMPRPATATAATPRAPTMPAMPGAPRWLVPRAMLHRELPNRRRAPMGRPPSRPRAGARSPR